MPESELTLPAFRLEHRETPRLLVADQVVSWVVPLEVGETLVGRGQDCHVRLEDSIVSRTHVAVRVDDQYNVYVRDLGSSNGSTINGVPVEAETPFKPGDALRLGHATLYLFFGSATDSQRLATESELHRRIIAEIERAVRNDCPCALLEVRLESPSAQAPAALASVLRPVDTMTELSPQRFLVLLPEVAPDAVGALAKRVLDRLLTIGTRARIGIATAPLDAADASILKEVAHRTAEAAELGSFTEPEHLRRVALGTAEALIGDPEMARVYALLERLAPTQIPVLIGGDTGVGKEFAAMLLHEKSPRRGGPFVPVNCAAIAPGVAEAELFGHARGAFTGAVSARAGFIESANGGTLFLDEIGDLALSVQANLLRVLETRTIIRVGEVKPRAIDVRVVTATHRDLESDVRTGRFREDLFFRIAGAQVELPALRRRPTEILPMAQAFLRAASGERTPPTLTVEVRNQLLAYHWPGNVRELRNAMQFVAGTCAEPNVRLEHLPPRLRERVSVAELPKARPPQATIPPVDFRPIAQEVRDLEIQRIREALDVSDWTKTKAASLIGMPLRTFTEKMKQYGIVRETPPSRPPPSEGRQK